MGVSSGRRAGACAAEVEMGLPAFGSENMGPRLLLLLGSFVWVPSYLAAEEPLSDNESAAILKAAKIGTDDASLLEFFRKRTLKKPGPDEIQTLIRQLG